MIPSLHALGRLLRRTSIAPTSVATLLERQEVLLAFRGIVREIFPEAEAEIWAAPADGGDRENARVWAFLQRVEAELFPVWECDEYEQVVCGVPIARNAWGYERFHALDMPLGELLLFVLCAYPYDDEGLRLPALDLAESRIPTETLRQIPPDGFTPAELRDRLSDTPYAGAADFADWLWGQVRSDCKGGGFTAFRALPKCPERKGGGSSAPGCLGMRSLGRRSGRSPPLPYPPPRPQP